MNLYNTTALSASPHGANHRGADPLGSDHAEDRLNRITEDLRSAAAANTRPRKRSLTLRGHRTSVSLEDDFWFAFREIAHDLQLPLNALVATIDAERGADVGLATAIRLFVLRHYRKAPS